MDEIERQLRRYADAAASQVPDTPVAPATPRRADRWRPILAAAAAVALIGATVGVFVATRDRAERIDTTPAQELPRDDQEDVPDEPPIRTECPIPPTDPKPGQLQMMLPWVTTASTETLASDFGRLHVVRIAPDSDDWIEVRVTVEQPPGDLVDPPADAAPIDVRVCDPFAFDDGAPSTVTASRSTDAEGNRSLRLPLSNRWTVWLRTGPTATSSVTDADLVAVVGGMAWPVPSGESSGLPPEPCPDDTPAAIGVGSFTLTELPDGFEPELPVETIDGGPADAGGVSTTTLTLVHPDGREIQVTGFATDSPSRYLAEQLGGSATENANVRRCIRIEGGWERSDNLALVGGDGDDTLLAAQEWEYEGYLLRGSSGVDQATLVTVAEGLRFGSGS